jgi:ABC-type glycerol-3-phosphate transport system permease component
MSNDMAMIARRRRDRFIMQALLTVMALVFVFPLYSAVKQSLRVNGFENFVSLFTDPIGGLPIWRTYVNAFAIGAIHAAVVVFVSTLAGYAFGKLRFPGRDFYYLGTILFLAIPGTAILVPLYYVTREMGLFNNYLGVGLPEAALTIPFGVLLMRNYADNVPDQVIEAAIVDRAGHLQIFRHVFLPISKPAIVNLTILCFMWSLQDFLWPSIFFTDPKLTTAAQAVSTFHNSLGQSPTDTARYSASLVLLAVPAVLLVVFGLRFITSGLTSGAVKD